MNYRRIIQNVRDMALWRNSWILQDVKFEHLMMQWNSSPESLRFKNTDLDSIMCLSLLAKTEIQMNLFLAVFVRNRKHQNWHIFSSSLTFLINSSCFCLILRLHDWPASIDCDTNSKYSVFIFLLRSIYWKAFLAVFVSVASP